jgi:hypothetical protein
MQPSEQVQLAVVEALAFGMREGEGGEFSLPDDVSTSEATNQSVSINVDATRFVRIAGQCLFDALIDRLDREAVADRRPAPRAECFNDDIRVNEDSGLRHVVRVLTTRMVR